MESFTPGEESQSVKIGEILEEGVPEIDEKEVAERAKRVAITDLTHEVEALRGEHGELIEEAQLHPEDPNLPDVVRAKTMEKLDAEADLIMEQRPAAK